MVEVLSLSYISHGPSGQWGNPSWSQEVIQSTNPNCQDMGNEVGRIRSPFFGGWDGWVGMDRSQVNFWFLWLDGLDGFLLGGGGINLGAASRNL